MGREHNSCRRMNDSCQRMTTQGRWTMDAGQRERQLPKNDNPWTTDNGQWAERTTVAEDRMTNHGRWTLENGQRDRLHILRKWSFIILFAVKRQLVNIQ